MVWTHRSFWVLPILLAIVLGLLSAVVAHTRLRGVYHQRFPESRRERLFLTSIGFFTTVILVRGLTLAIRHNIGPFHDVEMRGRHIHHLVWGILLAITAIKAKNDTFHNVLLVFAGWTLCWVSATIVRFVYPPPKRWRHRSESSG